MSHRVAMTAAALSLLALGACTVNTSPPVVAAPPAPATTVITPPAPVAAPGSTVVVPRSY